VILVLERSQTVKQLRPFIGAFTFYRDLFTNRSHILAPLTALVGGKGPLKWIKRVCTNENCYGSRLLPKVSQTSAWGCYHTSRCSHSINTRWMTEHLCLSRLTKQYFYYSPHPMHPILPVVPYSLCTIIPFTYIKGESNSLPNTFSRLHFDERQNPPD
jgi:hypothetical protein